MPNGASGVPRDDTPLSILPVRDRADRRRFFAVTREVYADDPQFVQPLDEERLRHIDPAHNPALQDIEAAYWVAMRGPRLAGRISCQVNQMHLRHHDDATAQFGFFEAIDDPEVIELLLRTAESWAAARGMQRLQGPFSLSINDESGLLVEGFDSMPNMMMPHGRPYYTDRLAALGYEKAKDLIAFAFDVEAPWPRRAEALIERTTRSGAIRFRPLDFSRFDEEIGLVCEIFNDAWSENWNFIPFGPREARHLAQSIRPLVTPECFAIGELAGKARGEQGGEPAAMSVTLPNLNEAIRDLDGRLLPFGWAKLLWRLKIAGVTSWRMPLMGVRKRLHGTAKGAALALGVIDQVKRYHAGRGVRSAELSWVLEDNHGVRDIIHLVGGRAYKTYRVFERALT